MFGTNLFSLFQSTKAEKPTFYLDLHEKIRSIGFATQNRYLVNFVMNPKLYSKDALWGKGIAWNSAVQKRLGLNCITTTLPSKVVNTKEVKDYGPLSKVAYGTSHDSVSMSFYVGADMFERYFFEQWVNCIQNPVSFDLNYYSEYTSQVDIYALPKFIDSWEDVLGNIDSIFRITLHDAFPSKIEPIQMDTSTGSSPMKLSVEFMYRTYDINSNVADEIANKELEVLLTDENGNLKQSMIDKILEFGDRGGNELLTSASSAFIFLKNAFN